MISTCTIPLYSRNATFEHIPLGINCPHKHGPCSHHAGLLCVGGFTQIFRGNTIVYKYSINITGKQHIVTVYMHRLSYRQGTGEQLISKLLILQKHQRVYKIDRRCRLDDSHTGQRTSAEGGLSLYLVPMQKLPT